MEKSVNLSQEYPFQSHFFSIQTDRLHYVDINKAGSTETMLLLHGNPTWSFYYRNVIKYFNNHNHFKFRIVAPDHIGMGLSDRPENDYNYTLQERIDNIVALIDHLQLKNIILVAHDWGGAIGMGALQKRPELFSKIIMMNTAAFLSKEIPWQINMLKNPIGEWAISTFNAFSYPATFMATTKKLPSEIKAGYLYPYHNFKSRIATARFVRDIPLKKDHISYKTLESIQNNLSQVKQPLLLLWGEKDFCFTLNFFKRWQEFFPQAECKTFPDGGHYLLEDELDGVLKEMDHFLSKNQKAN